MNRNDDENAADTTAMAASVEQTAEQTDVESDTSVDADTDGLTENDNAGKSENDENSSDSTTFSKSYVEKLRRESAGYRDRANRADKLAQRLHTALVAATGRMADPTDLAFDAAHLEDESALADAIDELLTRKPHLASRRLTGDVGQGNRGSAADAPVNLAEMLRARA